MWILHSFDAAAERRTSGSIGSRVLLAQIDCAGARWTLRHAATYAAAYATGRRLSADDFHPTEADDRPAAPGGVMDAVRAAACGSSFGVRPAPGLAEEEATRAPPRPT